MTQFTIGNSAGLIKDEPGFTPLLRTAVDEITIGSLTVERREGNVGETSFVDANGNSVNALGMPNPGINYVELWRLQKWADEKQKWLAVSIAPFGQDDLKPLCMPCFKAGVNAIELNGGCPNVWGSKSEQKKILSFSYPALEKMLIRLLMLRKDTKEMDTEIRIKLSPFSNPEELRETAEMIDALMQNYGSITIVTANTFPNAIMYKVQNGKPVPVLAHAPKDSDPKTNTLGGFSGTGYKWIGLGQVRQFRTHLPDHKIIGVGGINSGQDILEYQKAGANGVQIGSAVIYAPNPARALQNIIEEYASLL